MTSARGGTPSAWLISLLVASLGLLALYVSSFGSFRVLCASDELVYAVTGRNLAEGRGLVSGFYHARAILKGGYPLGDVHAPGYAILLASVFRLLGATPSAAFLPSALAFLLTGVVIQRVGRRLLGAGTGIAAAALFYLFPGTTGSAHTAMPEQVILLASALFLWLLVEVESRPSLVLPPMLALLLALGVTLRESFMVLLLPALAVLWRWPPSRRRLAIAGFAGTLFAYLWLVFRPLTASRATYPHLLSDLVAAGGPVQVVAAMWANAERSLGRLTRLSEGPFQWAFLVTLSVTVLLPALALLRLGPPLRRLAAYTLASALATLVGLAGFYPLSGSGGLRALLFLVPPGTLLLAGWMARFTTPARRAAAFLLAGVSLAGVSVAFNHALRIDRRHAFAIDRPISTMASQATAGLHPRVVIAEGAFLYGWEAYPVDVIWAATGSPAQVAALERRAPLDVILLGAAQKDALLGAVAAGQVAGGYRVIAEPAPGVFALASEEILRMRGRIPPR